MGADERIEDFEKWSRGRGLVARDVDRKRIAGELFEIAGRSSVSQDHIDQLIKRYRDGLVGANKVLLARRVAEEILTWQEEAGDTGTGASAPPPKRSEAPLAPPREKRDRETREKSKIESFDDFSLSADLDPPPSRSSSRPPPAASTKSSSVHPERMSARPPPKPDPSELDGFEADFGAPSNADEIPSASSITVSKRHARTDDDDDLGGSWLEPDEAPRRSSRPRAMSDAPIGLASARPGASVRATPDRGESKRPVALLESELALDDEPKRFQTGRSKPPSKPPPAGSNLPDVLADDRGVSSERRRRYDDISDSVAPPPAVGPVGAYPLGDVVTDNKRFSVTDYVSTKVMIGAGGAIFLVLFLAIVILRPSFLFGDAHKLVTGRVQIENLGASIEFRDQWFHSEDLDDDETHGQWVRHVSQFYRGGSDFQTAATKLTFIVFDSKKAMVSDDEARQLGTNETLNAAQRRHCEPFQFEGKKGTQCTALAGQFGRTYGVVETWYADSGKTIFTRAMIEMPMMAMGGGDPQQMAENQANFERELIAAFVEVEKVIFSFQITKK